MPARVAAIRAAIESRQDFTGLANGGEDAVVRWARTRGLNGRALILEWQQAYRQRQAQVERGHKKPLDRNQVQGFPSATLPRCTISITGVTPSRSSTMTAMAAMMPKPCRVTVCNGAGKDVTAAIAARPARALE